MRTQFTCSSRVLRHRFLTFIRGSALVALVVSSFPAITVFGQTGVLVDRAGGEYEQMEVVLQTDGGPETGDRI